MILQSEKELVCSANCNIDKSALAIILSCFIQGEQGASGDHGASGIPGEKGEKVSTHQTASSCHLLQNKSHIHQVKLTKLYTFYIIGTLSSGQMSTVWSTKARTAVGKGRRGRSPQIHTLTMYETSERSLLRMRKSHPNPWSGINCLSLFNTTMPRVPGMLWGRKCG